MSAHVKFIVRNLVLGLMVSPSMAAAPATNDFLNKPLMAEATIGSNSRIIQGSGQLSGFTPAPMPDLDRDAPIAQEVDPNAAHVAPKLFHKQATYHGEGYVFGSTVQGQQDRHFGPTPGINLIMPLQ